MKIAILGYSGSGKSTLARFLAGIYGAPALFIDTVQFLPDWVERDRDEGRSIVQKFMQNDSWVIDGNYADFLQKERLMEADRIILLLFPRALCLYRAWKRYRRFKNTTRESMADGCAEKLDFEFIRWILQEGRTKRIRAHYKEIASLYKEKTIVFKSQRDIDALMKRVKNSADLM